MSIAGKLTLSGNDSNDAHSYQEKDVNQAIEKVKEIIKKQQGEN